MEDTLTTPIWPPEQLDAGVRQVRDILATHGFTASDRELPPLTGEVTQSTGPDLLEKFIAWLKHFLPNFHFFQNSDHPVLLILVVSLAVLIVGGAIAAALIWLLRESPRFAVAGRAPGAALRSTNTPEQTLIALLSEARMQKDWSRAARVRWRIFLLRRSLAPGRTPREQLKNADSLERVMFAGTSTREEDFNLCENRIRELEAKALA